MKILITGVLGYIGGELCELYKNSADEIIGIDNNFIPDKVAWLIENDIKFYQRDLSNIKDLLTDCDIVYHCGGVTQVPQTKEQSNLEIDSLISKVGTDGTRYILNNLPPKCKFIFLSTHVIFEGYDNKFNLTEDNPPSPLLAYANSKYQTEFDLIGQYGHINYIIARLGSVYGYNPNMRLKIIGNLLSKMSAIDGKIKIFNGECYKPLIGILDCAAALKFLAESNYNREIFHLVNENIKVKEIGKICKDIVPGLIVEEVIDNSSNEGYTLNSDKLKKSGFNFKQNINDEIKNMINLWSNK